MSRSDFTGKSEYPALNVLNDSNHSEDSGGVVSNVIHSIENKSDEITTKDKLIHLNEFKLDEPEPNSNLLKWNLVFSFFCQIERLAENFSKQRKSSPTEKMEVKSIDIINQILNQKDILIDKENYQVVLLEKQTETEKEKKEEEIKINNFRLTLQQLLGDLKYEGTYTAHYESELPRAKTKDFTSAIKKIKKDAKIKLVFILHKRMENEDFQKASGDHYLTGIKSTIENLNKKINTNTDDKYLLRIIKILLDLNFLLKNNWKEKEETIRDAENKLISSFVTELKFHSEEELKKEELQKKKREHEKNLLLEIDSIIESGKNKDKKNETDTKNEENTSAIKIYEDFFKLGSYIKTQAPGVLKENEIAALTDDLRKILLYISSIATNTLIETETNKIYAPFRKNLQRKLIKKEEKFSTPEKVFLFFTGLVFTLTVVLIPIYIKIVYDIAKRNRVVNSISKMANGLFKQLEDKDYKKSESHEYTPQPK